MIRDGALILRSKKRQTLLICYAKVWRTFCAYTCFGSGVGGTVLHLLTSGAVFISTVSLANVVNILVFYVG
jgi:hypothetical protein